ncbi:hypothetical protein KXQ82_14930 [Mucilaginibacter sp. HMF5004]|uniref:hypothetical protein n=1 Tax=Mucilaginibacter rivuli TaxID=2857527 RepID=UPI001C5EADB7|nr:hypothetical protein [Mucilaginibacter rivuli]MBW4891018.1 hypothetical protein [Mucilaginibacter rivuli]
MTTITNSPASWASVTTEQKQHFNLWEKWLKIADSQAKNQTGWFAVSMISIGVLFLPLPAVLIYNYQANISVLAISMALFFANFIFGTGGGSIRTTLSLFVITIIAYITMVAIYIL